MELEGGDLAAPADDLEVLLLGNLEVRRGGVSLDVGGPQPRSVLAQLALDAGRVVSVDRLIERLWEGEPPPSALGTLQSYVSRIRRALEPGRRAGTPASVLVSEAPGYVLRIDRDRIDVVRFASLADEGRTLAATGRHADAVERFSAALALWRGPALGGAGNEDSPHPAAIRLQEDRLVVEEDRADSLLALGRHGSIVGDLHEAASEHPLRERRWCQLALCLYRCGRQADALRALSSARTVLAEELGLDPGPDLRRLESRILDHDPDLGVAAGAPAAAPAAPARVRAPVGATRPDEAEELPPEPPGTRPVLVGRDAEWRTVEGVLERVPSGAALVVVEGDAGIGKSTMLGEIAAACAQRGWQVVRGACVEEGLAPPLWPWIEVLREIGESSDDAGGESQALGFLETVAANATDLTAIEIADEIVDVLSLRARSAPLLVVIEDLHWADGVSLDVLPLVVARLGRARVAIVTAMRPLDHDASGPLADALASIARLPRSTRIQLDPLDAESTAALFALVAGEAPSDAAAVRRLHDRTGGNSLFVTELARLGSTASGTDVPDAIRDVVRRRLARLPRPTNDLLAVAAVLGQDIDVDLLSRVAGITLDHCFDDLDPAVVTRIVLPGTSGRLRFVHALVRDAVLVDLSPLRRARLHVRAAEAMEAVAGDDPDRHEPIAAHRWEARAIDDPILVAEALVRACDTGRRRGDHARSKDMADRALGILVQAPAGDRRDLVELDALESRLSIATREHTHHGVREDLDELMGQIAARSGGEIPKILHLFTKWGDVTTDSAAASRPYVEGGLDIARRSSTPYVIAMGRYMAATQAWLNGRVREAREHIEIAVDVCKEVDASDGALRRVPLDIGGMAAFIRATAGASAEEVDDAIALNTDGAWTGDRSDERLRTLGAVFTRAVLTAIADRPEEIPAMVAEVAADDAPSQLEPFWSVCRLLREWANARAGRTPDLDVARRSAVAIGGSPVREMVPMHHTFLADTLLLAGHADEALREADVAHEIATRTDEVWWLPETLRVRAASRLALGAGIDETERVLRDALGMAETSGTGSLIPRIRADLDRLTEPAAPGPSPSR